MFRTYSCRLLVMALCVGLTACADRVPLTRVSFPAAPETASRPLLPASDVPATLLMEGRVTEADLSFNSDAREDVRQTSPQPHTIVDGQATPVPVTHAVDTARSLSVTPQPSTPVTTGVDTVPASVPATSPTAPGRAVTSGEGVAPQSAPVVATALPTAGASQPLLDARQSQPAPTAARIKTTTNLPSWRIGPLLYIRQTLNNCGPASIAEVLRYWGIERTQGQVQSILRADGNPRGMVQYGVPGYMQALGMRVVMGVNGNDELVKSLVAHGFPVIVSQWVSMTDHYGHYRAIDGYDDHQGGFLSTDSYLGPNYFLPYGEFDQMWSTQGQRFMVIYPPSKEAVVQSVLADSGWNKDAAYRADIAKLRKRMVQMPGGLDNGRCMQSFGALSMAWDQMELGHLDVARAALADAAEHGANPVVVNWITEAMALTTS